MKKIIITVLASLPLLTAAQEKYTIRVSLTDTAPATKIYLYVQSNGQSQRDTAVKIKKNEFVLEGEKSAPVKAYLVLSRNGEQISNVNTADKLGIYLQKGVITVTAKDSLAKGTIGGTKLNNDQQSMMAALAGYHKAGPQRTAAEEAFIETHLNSLVGLNLIRSSVNPATELARAQKLFAKIDPALQKSEAGASFRRQIDAARAVEVGQIAPDFTLQNPSGRDISLNSYRGRYVLVDFWASWCAPCRKENPGLVAAYKTYRTKNFEILSISLDGGASGRASWLGAIKKDELSWEQVSDLRGWQNSAAILYTVYSIPSNFLIDPSGKIIARNLRGDLLQKKLAEIL